uniref:DUF3592 domain-containing protein n=1 Tax=Paractinoplanes polyasparticus TaxID=2856853 RepID=UPI001C865E44|nr:DUF3592 domain-containing protein [Actinoplanes polyasparticus]
MPGRLTSSLLNIAAGTLFFTAGLAVHRSHLPYPDGIITTATVTHVDEDVDDAGSTWYKSVYTFVTTDGQRVSFRDDGNTGIESTVGDRVEVSYRPGRPEAVRLVPGFDWVGWIIIGVGSLFVIRGCWSVLIAVLRRLL